MKVRALIVDDDRNMCRLLERDLKRRGLEVTRRLNAPEALAALTEQSFDVVLTDVRMPGCSGIELCRAILEAHPNVPVVVATAFGSMESAVDALRAGAYDFVTKPFELEVIALILERAIHHRALGEQVRMLEQVVQASRGSGKLLGESAAMQRLRSHIDRIADSEAAVLVTGESGTGKEVVARLLHDKSRRRDGPFVAVNCAALPGTLLESQLFGHEKGAFTDAREKRRGLFQQADGGTLLLDEVAEIPLELQPKLLRALETRQVRPVGSDREVSVDVRIIAATNRDLEHEVLHHRFREDLYFRVNVITLNTPPLRARGGDILLLAQHFSNEFAERGHKHIEGITQAVAKKLVAYDWPGNVRVTQRDGTRRRVDQPRAHRGGRSARTRSGTTTRPDSFSAAPISRISSLSKRSSADTSCTCSTLVAAIAPRPRRSSASTARPCIASCGASTRPMPPDSRGRSGLLAAARHEPRMRYVSESCSALSMQRSRSFSSPSSSA